ncbi:MAG: hypothetical protein AAF215_20300 [Cyanobacteria bacterium P01_A01_bin.123]
MTSSTHSHTANDPQHLEQLKQLAQNAIADGQLSAEERQALRQALFADGQLTAEEMDVIRSAFRERLGDGQLEFESP